MRILVDECVDERFHNSFSAHECQTARFAGLAGLKNGEVLMAAEAAGFEFSSQLIKELPSNKT